MIYPCSIADNVDFVFTYLIGQWEVSIKAFLMVGFFIGLFQITNYWDFPIYFVVGGCVIFFVNIRLFKQSAKQYWLVTLAQAAEVLLIGWAAASATESSCPMTISSGPPWRH